MFTRPLDKRQVFKLYGSTAKQHKFLHYSGDQSKSFYKGHRATMTDALRYKLLPDQSSMVKATGNNTVFKAVFITSDPLLNIS